ncbi:hypothetical protein D9M68_573180 [compost metagenome]
MIVGADADLPLHHNVLGLQVPYAVLSAAGQPGQRPLRQVHVELVVTLVVAEFHHIDAEALVSAEAVPDTDLGQQPVDEVQIAFVVLHHLFAPGIFPHQAEQEVLAAHGVTLTQDGSDYFRYRPLLENAELPCRARAMPDVAAGSLRSGSRRANRTGA